MLGSIILSSLPLNVVSWTLLAITVLIIGYRGLMSNHQTHNAISKFNSLYGITLGLDLISFYGPVWVTHNLVSLREAALVGSAFVVLSLIFEARLFWEIFLKFRIPLWAFLSIAIILLGISYLLDLRYLTVTFTPTLYSFSSDTVSSIIKGILIGGLLVPVGGYFVKQSASNTGLALARTLALGVGLIVIGSVTALNSIFYHTFDSHASVLPDTIMIALMFVVIAARLVHVASHHTQARS